MSAAEIAHGLVDPDGRLAEAEDALLGLVMRAGGGLGRTIALPQLAALARLAQRLQVPIARGVVVADRDADIELFVHARPEGDAIRLAVAGWRERPVWRPAGERVRTDLLAAESDWCWECDAALRLRSVSEAAGERDGFDVAGLLGRPLSDLFAFGVDAGGRLPILDALAERRSFAAQPASVRASGRRVLLSGIARRDAGDGFAGFSGGVVAAERWAPASLVAGVAGRLERALHPPLARIIADADSIGTGADGPVGPDYADYVADIAGAGRHLLSLVDDLADLEAVERHDFRPEIETIDLADLARRAAGLLSVRAANGGVSIARPGPDQRAPARGDFRRVLQILVNLLGNAVRHSPHGGVVDVGLGPGATLSVTDAGPGIAPEDRDRIFDKFIRLDPAESAGSGLGLYIACRLARAMNGDLTVDSAPGGGACFTLRLPPDAPRDEDQGRP